MGQNRATKNTNLLRKAGPHAAWLTCGLLLFATPVFSQSDVPAPAAASNQQQLSTPPATTAAAPAADDAIAGSIRGTILDATGVPVANAQVSLRHEASMSAASVVTGQNGFFSFTNIAPGPFELSVAVSGFKKQTVNGVLPANQGYLVPGIRLEVAPVVTDVSVHVTQEQVAEAQIKEQEQQRIVAVIPNFYVSYIPDAAPLNTKQKFSLAWRNCIDPVSIAIPAIVAGGEQASNSIPGYGQGAAGYFRRFGAAYGDFFIGSYISGAIFPMIFKQDPRYFYKGTGTVKSRVLYALARSVTTKGDNGHWQPDFSGILGAMASAGISNLYYPPENRHGFETTLNGTLIGIGTNAGVNLMQEFLFRRLTPKTPKTDHTAASPGS